MFQKIFKVFSVIIFVSAIVFSFQNCSQPGNIQMESQGPMVKPTTTDSMVIVEEENEVNLDDPDLVIDDTMKATCAKIEVSDFNLSLAKISTQGELKDASITITDANKNVSLDHQEIKISSSRDQNLNHLFLVLNAEGNKILDANNVIYGLKTPSAQTAGLKILLSQGIKLLANKNYILKLSINLEDQLVHNPEKCIFKPVIRGASIIEDHELQ